MPFSVDMSSSSENMSMSLGFECVLVVSFGSGEYNLSRSVVYVCGRLIES